jgi:hypothetical protein
MDKQEKLFKAVNAELEEWRLSGDVDCGAYPGGYYPMDGLNRGDYREI